MNEADDVRIEATEAAHTLLTKLRGDHGDILLHQSGGCCDGSAPMCYTQKEFKVGQRDVLLGTLSGVPFYVGGEQYRVWRDWFVTLDAKPGRAGIFSLEGTEGLRFVSTVRPLHPKGAQGAEPVGASGAACAVEAAKGGQRD